MTLELHTDRSLVRAAGQSVRYLNVAFTAPEAARRPERRPVNVAFILDRSGSMEGDKIRLAKEALETAVRMLQPDDMFSVVIYDDHIDVLIPPTRATADARRHLTARLSDVTSRGSTDLCAGWLTGCAQVADGASIDNIARAFLLSDGLANYGERNPDVLIRRAGELRRAYVTTSTFGVGADFDERLLASMAQSGGGSFYYIEHAKQIRDLLTSALGESLDVVARGAVVTLDLPPGVEAEVIHDLRTSRSDRQLRVELDDLVSSQDVSFIVRLTFPADDPGSRASVTVSTACHDGQLNAAGRLEWTFADHQANDNQPRNLRVDRLVAGVYAARARQQAADLNRAGDFTRASGVLFATQQRIRDYAGADSEMNRLAETLEQEERDVQAPMGASLLKRYYQSGVSASRMRTPDGLSPRRRTPPQK